MKNILKIVALLTLGTSIAPVRATEDQSKTSSCIDITSYSENKPNTIAAYAEAGISGLFFLPTYASLFSGYFVSLTKIAGTLVFANLAANKLLSKATRERAYEIRKAWCTLEIENGKLPKQKIVDTIYFWGCMLAPVLALSYCVKSV